MANTEYMTERAGIGPSKDVKAHGGRLYVIQSACSEHSGRLCVLSPQMKVMAKYDGIGNARQIETVGETAVISARESGVWIFDISDLSPTLLCHYQTVEYATGVTLYGNLAFISCRQYGVEVIDISNPRTPVHIGLIRVGEVQSATADNGILYCGVWGEMKVVCVDIRNIEEPEVIAEIPLDGRGDGVCVKDGVLYAATGQHARGIQNVMDKEDPAYGMGNGVEAFDVRDPHNPVRLCGRKFEKGRCAIDLWEAAIYGDTLVVNVSNTGVYGLDPVTLEERFHYKPQTDGQADAVTGVSVIGRDMYVTTAYTDLYAVRDIDVKDGVENRRDIHIIATPCNFKCRGVGAEASVVYGDGAPVLCAAVGDNIIALACAEGGVHLLDRHTLSPRGRIRTRGYAQDVKIKGDRLYVAEEMGGIGIYRLCGDRAEAACRIETDKPVFQLSVSESAEYIACTLSTNEVRMYRITSTGAELNYSYTTSRGPLYGNNFATGLMQDGGMLLFCHRDGLIYTNPEAGDDRFHSIEYIKHRGFCAYCVNEGIETDGEHIFFTHGGGYVFLTREDQDRTYMDDLPRYTGETGFSGLLTLSGGMMVASNRSRGEVTLLDVSKKSAPRVTARLYTSASTAKAVAVDGRILIPGGRCGLIEVKPTNV